MTTLQGSTHFSTRRREQLSLRDIIQAQGQRELRESVVADMTALEASIDKLRSAVSQAKREMREATDKQRKKECKQQYAVQLQNLALKLAVSPTPHDMMRSIAPKIHVLGEAIFPGGYLPITLRFLAHDPSKYRRLVRPLCR